MSRRVKATWKIAEAFVVVHVSGCPEEGMPFEEEVRFVSLSSAKTRAFGRSMRSWQTFDIRKVVVATDGTQYVILGTPQHLDSDGEPVKVHRARPRRRKRQRAPRRRRQ